MTEKLESGTGNGKLTRIALASEGTKLDLTSKVQIQTKGNKLRGVQLVGTGKLDTDDLIEKFIKKAAERRPNAAPKKRNASETEPQYVPLSYFGFQNYP